MIWLRSAGQRAYGAWAEARNRSAIVLTTLVVSATPAAAEGITILALGDSLTQGYGLPPEEGFVPQLEAWLTGEGIDASVINGGVSGDTTAGGLARVGWSLTPEVDAMIVALGGNDLLRGLDPAQSRANLDGILAEAAGRDLPVLLIGLPAPSNYGPEFKAEFDAIYPDLSEEYGTLLYPSFLEALGDELNEVQPFMQSDGIHPNADGVARIVGDLGPLVADLAEAAEGPVTE